VLVDEFRFKKYKKEPLIFNGKKYEFDYIIPNEKSFKADFIFIATKNNHIDSVLSSMKNFVHDDTIILSLLNGLKSEYLIASMYGENKVLDSYYIGHTSTRQGRQIVHDGVYKTVFGEKYNSVYSDRVKKIKKLFDKTNIQYEIPLDMEYSKWWKFLVNVGYNQASVLLNASYGDFHKFKKINEVAINLMQEAAQIAKAENVKNTENFIPEILAVINDMLPNTRTSMLQDIDAKRETEVDAFSGYVLELGRKYNIDTPFNKVAYSIIKAMDERNLL